MVREVETLMEMGFSKERAEKALQVTNNKGVEPAMEWLLQHNEDIVAATVQDETADEPAIPPQDPTEEAKSLKCDVCNKLFKNQDEVEFHAAKSGHSSFSESTEEKKPLTEEEKKEQLAKLEERMKQKRKEREDREKAEALEKEKLRIRSGKDMQDAKQRLQDQEIQKMIEQRRRDKIEDQQARERVKQQIQADRDARKQAEQDKLGTNVPAPTVPPIQVNQVAAVNSNYSQAKLQFRLPDGKQLTQTFGAKEQLAAVRLFVQLNFKDEDFSLKTTFPTRTFSLDDYDKPLDVLGLVPSAVVIVSKLPSQ